MNKKQQKAFLNTRLRNLKRKYAKVKENPVLIEEAIDLKADIDAIEKELEYL